jgi:hypothetical protein
MDAGVLDSRVVTFGSEWRSIHDSIGGYRRRHESWSGRFDDVVGDCVIEPMHRIRDISQLNGITKEVVEAARETLLIGT